MADVEGLRYPKELVERYGAKAGVLMYVAKQRPDIPQMRMIASETGEDPADFFKRVKKARIRSPWLFRSSAQDELLGKDGDYPTVGVRAHTWGDEWAINVDGRMGIFNKEEDQQRAIVDQIAGVMRSPQKLSRKLRAQAALPDEINVIATTIAPSEYIGTYIKHPNQDDLFITTIKQARNPDLKLTATLGTSRDVNLFGRRTNIAWSQELGRGLGQVINWHDKIAGLEEMDSNWSYIIEFGLLPQRLFQVKPFKRTEKAAYNLVGSNTFDSPLVIGITPPEGIEMQTDGLLHSSGPSSSLPRLWTGMLRDLSMDYLVNYGPNPGGFSLTDCGGVLEHKDIKALRAGRVSILHPGLLGDFIASGVQVNLVSDGRNVQITEKDF